MTTTDTVPMKESYLVQRLERPSKTSFALLGKDNPFSFGGGIRNGGLSDDAMDLLRDIFQFDYMGAAEYEWGAVPEALSMIAKADDLTTDTITVPLDEVPEPWRSQRRCRVHPNYKGIRPSKAKENPSCTCAKIYANNQRTLPDKATIYILVPAKFMDEAKKRVAGWARNKGPDLRDPTQLGYSLKPYEEWDERRCGWLELNNGFMFFTAEDMWASTCDLFGVER